LIEKKYENDQILHSYLRNIYFGKQGAIFLSYFIRMTQYARPI